MKLTKKVLSLILAAALLVGTVAVAANAETLTQYAGSVMSYFITSDKDVSDGNAEVKPGETITVTVSMTTNFYPGSSGGETIFWTKGFFESDTPDVAMDDIMGLWKHTTTYPVTTSSAYPSDYPMASYVMYLNNRGVNTDMTGTELSAFDNQTLYTVTFTVPADAEVGSSAVIALPASKLSTATQTGRNYTMCQSVSGTTTMSSTKAKGYAETVNVDALTVTVVEEQSEEPPVVEDPILTYEGSKMSYFVTSDKDVSDGKAEVKPGDTINVTVSMTTNFYPGSSGGETIFWTKGFFESDTPDVAMDSVMGLWKHTTTYPVTTSSAYPSDYPMSSYVMYLNNRGVNTDMTGTELNAFSNQTLYTMSFQIPADAEVGSTAVIALPASKLSTATQTGRNYTMCQSVSGTTTMSSTKAKGYAETVNVDALEITVVSDGGTEPPVVEYADLTALKTALDKAAVADTANCTSATVAEFEAAKTAAQTLYDSKPLASQAEEVAAAAKRLEDAITGLKKLDKVNYEALEAAKADYEAKVADKDNYSNWAEYEALYNVAAAIDTTVVYDDEQGTIQAKVDAAAKALDEFALVEYGKVNYTALNDAIAAYEEKVADKDNYSNWAEYEALYNTAKEIDQTVVYDKNGEQAEADAAAKALNDFVLTEYAKVNYDALNDAIAAYDAKVADKDIYSNWAEYEALYNEAKAIDQSVVYDKNGEQAAADAAAKALNDFVLTEYAKVNYDALNDAIAAYEDKLPNANLYANWAEYEALYNVAKAIDQSVVYDKNGEQAEVDAAAEALANFQLEDKTLSYDKWNAAVDAIPADLAGFKPASVTAYEAAKAQAEADKDAAVAALDQTALDAAADALTAAIALLEAKADNSALVAAVARASALLEENYTPDSWVAADLANVLAAANVVLANGDATAEEIAEQVAAIEAAEAKLVVKADKAALLEAINAAAALVANEAAYTPASFAEANLAAVMADAQVVYENDNATPEDVANAIAALKAAEAKLVLKADKAALEAAINTEVVLENATAESLAEYNAKLQAAQAVLADDNASEEEVLAATNNLLAAIDALDYYGACDYTAYNDAVKAANELVADEYTTSSWAAADIEAVLAANAVEEGLMDKDGNQDKINAAAQAINDAIALLEKKADVSALADALAKDPKVPEQYATVETWTAYAQAKAEAQDILDNAADTGVSAQGAVDAAVKALNDANEALAEQPASYAAVEEALALVESKGELNQYTQASVKALEKAIAAVVYDLGISRQDDIEAWAKDIVDAANALEVSKASVTNVKMLGDRYIVRETRQYEVTVNGAPIKIQFVNYKGGTVTYSRNTRGVTVVSYNANGEVIDYAEEEPAYEVWTVSTSLGEGVYQAKAKNGSVWDIYTYEFEIELVDPAEDEVYFVAAPADGSAEAGKTLNLNRNAPAVMTAVTPDTVNKVQLYFTLGSKNFTTTYGLDSAYAEVVDNGDGTLTWTLNRNFSTLGEYTMALKLRDANGWYDAVTEAVAVTVTSAK